MYVVVNGILIIKNV